MKGAVFKKMGKGGFKRGGGGGGKPHRGKKGHGLHRGKSRKHTGGTVVAWHATPTPNVANIMKNGFKARAEARWLGKGCYFTEKYWAAKEIGREYVGGDFTESGITTAMPTRATNVTPCTIKFTSAVDMDAALLALEKDEGQIQAWRDAVRALNPDKDDPDLFAMKTWDIAAFDEPHLPVVVAPLSSPGTFSTQRGLRILDMAIYMPAQGWALPLELEQFRETVLLAYEHEKMINPDINQYYIYITVDQKVCEPNTTQRRPGYHSDAYETEETDHAVEAKAADNTYIVYDAIPTHFQPGPFPLAEIDSQDCAAVLAYFDKMSEGKPPVHYPLHTMVKLTPFNIHTPALNATDRPVNRTFVKISFSKKRYNLVGNRINDTLRADGKLLLDYSGWQWVDRDPVSRNHRNRILNWRRPDNADFRCVLVSEVDFQAPASWLKGNVFHAARIQTSHAERAVEGEVLTTKHGDFVITYNIAQQGDWKITTQAGDSYFISNDKFCARYDAQLRFVGGMYRPKGAVQPMIEIAEPVRLLAPWGAMQYLPVGSVLTRSPEGDIYGIHIADRGAYATLESV